jgi:hypothetical protein
MARSPDSIGQIFFVFYKIYHVGDSACTLSDKLCPEGNISVCILKCGRDIFVEISQIQSLYVGNH